MKTIRFNSVRTPLVIAIAALLGACGSIPQNARLDEARSSYNKAATDPQIVRGASSELRQAKQALEIADAALQSGDDPSAVDHYAYLARQRTEIAMQAGKIGEAEQAVARSQKQRDRILIDARTSEAEARTKEAEARTKEAEASSRDAAAAQKLAEERLAAAELARQQASEADARAAALEAQLAELKARKTDRGMVLTLGDVLFDTGLATLKAGAMRTVDQLANFLEKNPTRKVLIEGHTDSVGGDEYNRGLSQRRADAVRQALTDRRITVERIETKGLGEGYPVANNATAAGRQQNRRVEVIFSDDNGSIKARTQG